MARRRYHRDLLSEARRLGLSELALVRGGKHPRILGVDAQGVWHRFIVSNSPGDVRSLRNAKAFMRRALEGRR